MIYIGDFCPTFLLKKARKVSKDEVLNSLYDREKILKRKNYPEPLIQTWFRYENSAILAGNSLKKNFVTSSITMKNLQEGDTIFFITQNEYWKRVRILPKRD